MRFIKNVFIPSALPLLLLAAVRSLPADLPFNWIAAFLLVAAAWLYLKRLNLHWGYVDDIVREVRRFKFLVWLLLLLLPLDLLFLLDISIFSINPSLSWIYLISAGLTYFIFLTLLLQFYRFSSEINLRSMRFAVGLGLILLAIMAGWSGPFQFLLAFHLIGWIFKFESGVEVSIRHKIVISLTCIIGIFLLLGTTAISDTPEDSSSLILGNISVSARVADSVMILKSNLLPLFPDFLAGLRRLLIAFCIVFPGKIILNPIANWLKFSLRIKTKLALSYLFSSIIPVFLLIVILLFGVLFMMGAFWQIFMNEMVAGQTDTLAALWNSSVLSVERRFLYSLPSEYNISEHLKMNGISAVFADVSPTGKVHGVRYGGAILPNLTGSDSLTIELLHEVLSDESGEPKLMQIRTKLPVLRIPGVVFPSEIGADSLVIKLADEEFTGFCWFEETPFLTRWMKKDNRIIGLFQPFIVEDLVEMKSRCGSDLMIIPGHGLRVEELASGGVNIGLGGSLSPAMRTRVSESERAALDFPISFPSLLKSLSWQQKSGFEETYTIMVAETSLFSVFGVLLSSKNFVNRIYITIFIILAVFFGAILILVALIGFSLAGGITRSIQKIRAGTRQLSEGNLNANIQVKSHDELGELAGSFNLMVADLNRMLEEVKEKERLEGELEAAKAIQKRLLPEFIPKLSGFEIAATSLPAKQVGGDYFDFIELNDKRLGLAVGDVSGKGMPAALLMANLQASLRALAQSGLPPEELVGKLNSVLHYNTAPEMFATFFFASLDPVSSNMSYVNAGHNYPIVCGNDRLVTLEQGGMLLGVMPDEKYQSGEITLQQGEIVALYSDGITEACDGDDREFGEERLIQILQDCSSQSAESILSDVITSVENYCGTPQDDLTLMVVKKV